MHSGIWTKMAIWHVVVDAPVYLTGRMIRLRRLKWCHFDELQRIGSAVGRSLHRRLVTRPRFTNGSSSQRNANPWTRFPSTVISPSYGPAHPRLGLHAYRRTYTPRSVRDCLVHVAADGRRQLKISDSSSPALQYSILRERRYLPRIMAVECENGRHLLYHALSDQSCSSSTYNFAHDLEAALGSTSGSSSTKSQMGLDPDASTHYRSEIQYSRDELLMEEKSPQW
ncbi:hypothetical protein CPB85DRAFT_460636 [Mucidula mucida]|nr:hypothetical protein CPB85DRAFT_460636 [Mucidula mucida]